LIPVNDALRWGKEEIMKWLQEFFAMQPNGMYRYDHENEANTEIVIIDKHEVLHETTDKRPALAISLSGSKAKHETIGDMAEVFFPEGEEKYIDTYVQNLVVNCMSTVGLEAEEIASIVFSGFQYNIKDIMKRGFTKVRPQGTGSETVISADSKADIISVPVFVELTYTVAWKIRETNPIQLGSLGYNLNFE